MKATVYEEEDKKISRKKVLEEMERKEWVNGIARSAFHMTAARETRDGKVIFFDSRDLFY